MFLRLGAVLSIFALGTASAQDLPPLPDLQLDTPQQTAQTSVLDEPIRQIADTSGGCTLLDKDFPGLRQHEMYPFFKSMSLNQIAALSKGQITTGMLAQAKIDIMALQAKVLPPAVTPPSATTVAAPAPP